MGGCSSRRDGTGNVEVGSKELELRVWLVSGGTVCLGVQLVAAALPHVRVPLST